MHLIVIIETEVRILSMGGGGDLFDSPNAGRQGAIHYLEHSYIIYTFIYGQVWGSVKINFHFL